MWKASVGFLFSLFLVVVLKPGAVSGRIIDVGPSDSWCSTINNAAPAMRSFFSQAHILPRAGSQLAVRRIVG
jgi:hypothetical protein